MKIFDFISKKPDDEEVKLSYKPITMTPELRQRQYEEQMMKNYKLRKKPYCSTK